MDLYIQWRNQMVKIILIIELILGLLMSIAFYEILKNKDRTEASYIIAAKNDSTLKSRTKLFNEIKMADKKHQDTLNEILKILRRSNGTR